MDFRSLFRGSHLATTGDPECDRHAQEEALSLWRGRPLAGSDFLWAEASSTNYTPPCSTYYVASDRDAYKPTIHAAHSKPLNEPSPSITSTSRAGVSRWKRITHSVYTAL
jgi:hypothetical protein